MGILIFLFFLPKVVSISLKNQLKIKELSGWFAHLFFLWICLLINEADYIGENLLPLNERQLLMFDVARTLVLKYILAMRIILILILFSFFIGIFYVETFNLKKLFQVFVFLLIQQHIIYAFCFSSLLGTLWGFIFLLSFRWFVYNILKWNVPLSLSSVPESEKTDDFKKDFQSFRRAIFMISLCIFDAYYLFLSFITWAAF